MMYNLFVFYTYLTLFSSLAATQPFSFSTAFPHDPHENGDIAISFNDFTMPKENSHICGVCAPSYVISHLLLSSDKPENQDTVSDHC